MSNQVMFADSSISKICLCQSKRLSGGSIKQGLPLSAQDQCFIKPCLSLTNYSFPNGAQM